MSSGASLPRYLLTVRPFTLQVSTPVWPVACSLSACVTTLLSAASELLSIGDFTAHERIHSLKEAYPKHTLRVIYVYHHGSPK